MWYDSPYNKISIDDKSDLYGVTLVYGHKGVGEGQQSNLQSCFQ